ncbi:MAG TPA: DapH/DapD/GlmU-related protein [Myxococcota bacterium]|nr:DapH/DapD/GlmU-related protein [Myxococcota bacterium]
MDPSAGAVLQRPRAAFARRLQSGVWSLRVAWLRRVGISAAARALATCHPMLRLRILRAFGARIGEGATILGPFHVMNPGESFSALRIGRDAWIGPDVLVDLTRDVEIGDRVAISARCSLVTHMNVGVSRLKDRYSPVAAPVRVADDAYLGTGAVILHGVELGAGAVVAAGAVVRAPVAPGAVVAGVPAREVKHRETAP